MSLHFKKHAPQLGSFICFGISVACWVAFVGVLAMLIMVNGGDPVKVAKQFLSAAEQGYVQLVKALLDAGVPVDLAESRTKVQAIHKAAERSGTTALEIAVQRGNLPLAELLIDKGASAKGNRMLFQAVASWRGEDRILKLLVAHGAELETPSIGGETPLLYAASKRRLDAAKVLLAAGAKVNVAGPRRRTPLHLAVLHRDILFSDHARCV